MIKIFVTGGTFDKIYDQKVGGLGFKNSHLEEILALCQCQVPVCCETLMLIDSLHMNDQDRMIIKEHIELCKEEHILITHGTDTMVATAQFLDHQHFNKTVVLTGSMIPYSMPKSDALFNLGSSLAYVQILPPGVYVAMNGVYFHPSSVAKNKHRGTFERIASSS